MNRLERIPDLTTMLRTAMRGLQSDIWTALPGGWVSAGSKKGTANVQPLIKVQLADTSGTLGAPQNLPVCPDCPVIFPGGGGFHFSFPLTTSTEGLLVFASRCIDNWWLSGGPQSQAELRMHDLSDGFFVPGCFSQPNAPSVDFSTTAVRMTKDDATMYYELDPLTSRANVVAAAGLWVNGVQVTVP